MNSEEIKPVAIAIIELHLSGRKGWSESVSQSVENRDLKFHSNLVSNDLKTF